MKTTNEGLRLRRMLSALGVLGVTLAGQGVAQAADLLFYQDWQEPTAFGDWTTTGTCRSYVRANNNLPPNPESTEQANCVGRYATETIDWSGGRVFSSKPVSVAAGDRVCVTSWIRANGANAERARPFIGVNYASNANGLQNDNQGAVDTCAAGEHWLIGDQNFNDSDNRNNCGGRSTVGYGVTTQVAPDNDWHYYSKTFEVDASDVINGNRFLVLKLQNFSGGLTCDPGVGVQGAHPGADFDDIRVYRLGVGEVCPTEAEVLADGDDAHQTCSGTTPFCVSSPVAVNVAGVDRQVTQLKCEGCSGSYGDNTPKSCAEANPACGADGACAPCDGDAGTNAAHRCGALHPVCNAVGGGTACGQCQVDADCVTPGITHAGTQCIGGVCSNECTIEPLTGVSNGCTATQFCATAEGGVVKGCNGKLANGATIPSRDDDPLAVRGQCVKTAEFDSAALFCASGVCEGTQCGLADGSNCTENAECRANRCAADGKCGLPRGEACLADGECRGDIACIDGNCGGPIPQCTVDADCAGVGFFCDATGRCDLGCRGVGGNGCPSGKVCSSTDATVGQCVDAESDAGASSSGGSSGASSSGATPDDAGASSSGGTTPDGGGASSGGGNPDDPDALDGVLSGGAGCAVGGADAGSLVPMLAGVGVMLGALRRRRRH